MKEKSELKKMEELDARIEKINYDLMGLENRKQEMENNKIDKQKEIDKLEKEKNNILGKTDTMKTLQKLIYIAISLRTDLKKVELINTKISEHQKEKDNIQNKIDIQNGLYAETIKEKDKYIEQRRQMYMNKNTTRENIQENNKASQIKALTQIYEIATQFKNNRIMNNLSHLVEKEIEQYLKSNNTKTKIVNTKQEEEQDEIE